MIIKPKLYWLHDIYHCYKTLVLCVYRHLGRIPEIVYKMLCYQCLSSVVWDESRCLVA